VAGFDVCGAELLGFITRGLVIDIITTSIFYCC